MASPKSLAHQCPQCGTEYTVGTLVCPNPQCRAILAPHRSKKQTPVWVVALLSAIIVALLIYIVIILRNGIIPQ